MAIDWSNKPKGSKGTYFEGRFQHMEANRRALQRSENELEKYKQKLKEAKENKNFHYILLFEKAVKFWSNDVLEKKRDMEHGIREYNKGSYGR